MIFPKLSAPLIKDIRTGEGVAEWALGLAVSLLTVVGDMGVVRGTAIVTILVIAKGARRGLLKVIALTRGHIGPPIEPLTLEHITADTAVAGEVVKSVVEKAAKAKP